jgi:hypothetical protein
LSPHFIIAIFLYSMTADSMNESDIQSLIGQFTSNGADCVYAGTVSIVLRGDCSEAGNERQTVVSPRVQHLKGHDTQMRILVKQEPSPPICLCTTKKSSREAHQAR